MAYAPPVSSLVTLNVLWSRSTPTTFPSPEPRMIGTVVSVSGRNLVIWSFSAVIPGPERQRGSPESITTGWEYGFRARRYAASRNDGGGILRQTCRTG